MNSPVQAPGNTPQSLYDWTQIIYALHALSLVIGIVGLAGAATVLSLGTLIIVWTRRERRQDRKSVV